MPLLVYLVVGQLVVGHLVGHYVVVAGHLVGHCLVVATVGQIVDVDE